MRALAVWAVLGVVLLLASSAFVVDVSGDAERQPVPFDRTISFTTVTQAEEFQARQRGLVVPKAEVFYSQYQFVVGYYGVESLVGELQRPGHERQYGRPLSIYVSDFSGEEPSLTDDGYLRVPETRTPGWVAVDEAAFVVDSEARTTAGDTVVPFSDRADARAFADAYGGRVVDWAAVRSLDVGDVRPDRDDAREAVAARQAWANDSVAATRPLLDRPVSVVVGRDAPNLSAAVAQAPPNTTVRLPPGTYDVSGVTVNRSLTIRGAGANATVLDGGGRNGTVLTATADRVAVADLAIRGVGPRKQPEDVPVNESTWDYNIVSSYGYADAALAFDRSNGSLASGLRVDTVTNGVVVRYSEGVVVRDVTVRGTEAPFDGYMNVLLLDSRAVVEDSRLVDGRDGVYTHLGHGSVVRDNEMHSHRFGVHEMYTSRMLVSNNTVREATTGIVIMTRPEGNAVVGNDVRRSDEGVNVAGSDSFVVGNVFAYNDRGMDVSSQRSLYADNVVAENGVGAAAGTLIPTNRVVGNDFVDNDRYVETIQGPLRVWTGPEGGNYWSGAPGFDRDGDGRLERAFHPSSAVDANARRPGGDTLAHAPAVGVLRWQTGQVPGLRATGVVDTAPLDVPANPRRAAEFTNATAPTTSAVATSAVAPSAAATGGPPA